MLELICATCESPIMLYQKDGPGPLLRCYWDRIHEPKSLTNLHLHSSPPKQLLCPKCNAHIGKQALYEKENRLVFTLEEESVHIKNLY